MPVALEVDKELIKALVLQGISNRVIAEKFSVNPATIQTWINRHGWRRVQSDAIAFLKQEKGPLLAETVANASIASRKAIAERIKQAAELIPAPTSYRQAMRQQEDMESLVRNGEKLFQWSQAGQSSMVSIQSLSQDAPQVGQLSDATQPSQIIDVEPVKDVATQ